MKQKKKTSDIGRPPFSDAHINIILESIINTDNNIVRKSYQRWGTLIGIYTGARLNEICQLHVTDIQKVDDVWCFDLNDDGSDKKLKAAASKRRVPIHPQLIELGFLNHVEQLKNNNQIKIFPEFTYCVKNGWGRHLGRWFNNQLLPTLGIKTKELVFHSLRVRLESQG